MIHESLGHNSLGDGRNTVLRQNRGLNIHISWQRMFAGAGAELIPDREGLESETVKWSDPSILEEFQKQMDFKGQWRGAGVYSGPGPMSGMVLPEFVAPIGSDVGTSLSDAYAPAPMLPRPGEPGADNTQSEGQMAEAKEEAEGEHETKAEIPTPKVINPSLCYPGEYISTGSGKLNRGNTNVKLTCDPGQYICNIRLSANALDFVTGGRLIPPMGSYDEVLAPESWKAFNDLFRRTGNTLLPLFATSAKGEGITGLHTLQIHTVGDVPSEAEVVWDVYNATGTLVESPAFQFNVVTADNTVYGGIFRTDYTRGTNEVGLAGFMTRGVETLGLTIGKDDMKVCHEFTVLRGEVGGWRWWPFGGRDSVLRDYHVTGALKWPTNRRETLKIEAGLESGCGCDTSIVGVAVTEPGGRGGVHYVVDLVNSTPLSALSGAGMKNEDA